MECIDLATAESLISFSAGKPELESLGRQQLEGAVALHNKLAERGVAYLADEVGMGKTYIALGVVALMRRLNPSLRVLYLLPKNNVRDKWRKDYNSFVEYNYRQCDLAVKGINNRPAAPYVVCSGLQDLVQSVATSSARDYFICTSAFSFALGNSAGDLRASLDQFVRLLPQYRQRVEALREEISDDLGAAALGRLKTQVKAQWAGALNSILPRFDLVVVDEAHNLKKSRNSSDRNQLLATLLGADDSEACRVGRLLLLSATPFDRQLDHLRNQLALFGFASRMALPEGNAYAEEATREVLAQLMVRRLNAIELNKVRHTRNMYRDEHRSGDQAEVVMGLEQQLFAALLQKKVSDYLQENCAGRFELGMLASFESYLPGEKNKAVEFDGQDEAESDDCRRDARDRHVVESLVDDYWRSFGNQMPPHPKMDWVVDQVHHQAFEQGKKQLIFVRRVRSVAELKSKLDSAYDAWLGEYIRGDAAVHHWFERYQQQARDRSVALGMTEVGEGDEVAASSDNFFTWFYRGKNAELESAAADGESVLQTLPFNYRTALAQTSLLFEPNWSLMSGMPVLSDIDWQGLIPRSERKPTAQLRFRHAQFAYLKTLVQRSPGEPAGLAAQRILAVVFGDFRPGLDLADPASLTRELGQSTLWNVLGAQSQLEALSPDWGMNTFEVVAGPDVLAAERLLRRHLTHMELLGVVCRLDHPFIDLYSLRGVRKENDEESADSQLIGAFAALLARQAEQRLAFCSFQILRDVVSNLDLLVKLNFPDAYHTKAGELTRYLTRQLNPVAPVSGATGENSTDRSPLARKFRMPGYPRVLVSTDVFQEGEDLHTFCDSVVHYGISSSPIALEQKIGRVDRVASLAHRAMTADPLNCRQHFIRVGYPHIRQSLEFFQVRQAAANLNAFQRSLHELGGSEPLSQEVVIQEHLRSNAGIEPQIREFLQSPFEVRTEDLNGSNRQGYLQEEQRRLGERLEHVRQQVALVLRSLPGQQDAEVRLHEGPQGWAWRSLMEPAIELQLRSARALPELLLAASLRDSREFPGELADAIDRVACLQELQRDSRVRLQLFDDKDEGRILRRNAEVYAGAQGVLIDAEIHNLYWRVVDPGAQQDFTLEADGRAKLASQIDSLCGDDGRIGVEKPAEGLLRYRFHHEGREQLVAWQLMAGHVLISSRVLDREQTLSLAASGKSFAQSPLVVCTLLRNVGFDMVDFHVNDCGELAVRACHPAGHLNREELAFLARSVAAEADRLEQILRGAEHDEQ